MIQYDNDRSPRKFGVVGRFGWVAASVAVAGVIAVLFSGSPDAPRGPQSAVPGPEGPAAEPLALAQDPFRAAESAPSRQLAGDPVAGMAEHPREMLPTEGDGEASLPSWAIPYGGEFWHRQPLPRTSEESPDLRLGHFNFDEAIRRNSHSFRVGSGQPSVAAATYEVAITASDFVFSPYLAAEMARERGVENPWSSQLASPPAPEWPDDLSEAHATNAREQHEQKLARWSEERARLDARPVPDPAAWLEVTPAFRLGASEAAAVPIPAAGPESLVHHNTHQTRVTPWMVQHIEARADGVEMVWVLSEPPPEPGSLWIDLGIDGLQFTASSASGFHFADDHGVARARVSPARAMDMAGLDETLPMKWQDGSLHIEVPEALLASASYPLAIDPLFVPQLAKDINLTPEAYSSSPANLTPIGDYVFFTAQVFETVHTLWRTNGSAEGTKMILRDERLQTFESAPNRIDLPSPAGQDDAATLLYFRMAETHHSPPHLWRSDGTAEGTFPIHTDDAIQSLRFFEHTRIGNRLLFYIAMPNNHHSFWVTEGTVESTIRIDSLDLNHTAEPAESFCLPDGTRLFQVAAKGASATGQPLGWWQTDGTVAGTQLVDPPPAFFNFSGFRPSPIGDEGFIFTAYSQSIPEDPDPPFGSIQLWWSDGTDAGTQYIKTLNRETTSGSVVATHFQSVGSNFYFMTTTAQAQVHRLWYTDGTTENTRIVATATRANEVFQPLHDGVVFAEQGDPSGATLSWINGTVESSVALHPMPQTGGLDVPTSMVTLSGRVVFSVSHPDYGREIWATDGTAEGTGLVADIFPGHQWGVQSDLHFFKDRVVFVGDSPSVGRELWVSDGTTEGTRLIVNLTPRTGTSLEWSNPTYTATPDFLFFFADDGIHGFELWRTDGTEEGTQMVRDVIAGPGSGIPERHSKLVSLDSHVYYFSTDGFHGFELWRSDGTEEGTHMVKDINPGISSAVTTIGHYSTLIPFQNTILFTANNGVDGWQLWRSNGTEEGTYMVKQITPSFRFNDPLISFLGEMSNVLYFAADDDVHGRELWRTTGTEANTFMVKDIAPGIQNTRPRSSNPWVFATIGRNGYFFAETADHGRELWTTRGTEATTALVHDIHPGATGSFNGTSLDLLEMDGWLYFPANDGVHGRELWRSRGSPSQAPEMVADLRPGSSSSNPSLIGTFDDSLFFVAADELGHQRVWRTEGTEETTRLVPVHERVGSNPWRSSVVIEDKFFYITAAGPGSPADEARTLWMLRSGEEEPTYIASSSRILNPVHFQDKLMFAMHDIRYGLEMWWIDLSVEQEAGFEAYIASLELDGPDALPDATPFGDGLPNLVRYVMDLPASPAPGQLPALMREDAEGEAEFVLEFRRRNNHPDVNLIVESSTDLQNWSPLPEQAIQRVGDADEECGIYRAWLPTTPEARAFLRFRAVPE